MTRDRAGEDPFLFFIFYFFYQLIMKKEKKKMTADRLVRVELVKQVDTVDRSRHDGQRPRVWIAVVTVFVRNSPRQRVLPPTQETAQVSSTSP